MRQRDMATLRSLLFQEFSGQPESALKFQKFNVQNSNEPGTEKKDHNRLPSRAHNDNLL